MTTTVSTPDSVTEATANGSKGAVRLGTILGPAMSPARWRPPQPGPHTVPWSGHVGNPHGSRPDPGLLVIGVDAVLEAARNRLTGPSKRPTELAVRR